MNQNDKNSIDEKSREKFLKKFAEFFSPSGKIPYTH